MARKKKQVNIYVQTRKKREAEFAKHENKYISTPVAKFFPIVITIVLLIAGAIVFYLFNTYKNVITISQSGYFLSSKYDMEDLKKNVLEFQSKLTPEHVETVKINNGENVYRTPLNHYFDTTKTNEIDLEYPLFANNGLAIINYNEETNLITTDFIRYEGYEGLILSYGKAYDEFRYTQIDDLNYLVLSYANGLFINLYDIKLESNGKTYDIPVNSILYFEKDLINLYERDDNAAFKKISLTNLNLDDKITFYYDGTEEEYTYKYQEFLEGIGTLYIAKEVEKVKEEPVYEEKPTPPERKKVEETRIVEESTWEEPEVSVSNIKVKTYSISGDIVVKDPAHVIVKEPTFTFELDGKQVLRRSYSGSRNFNIAGLMSETKYKVTGTYTYLDEDMETKRIVKFYEDTITTKSLNDLDNIELSYQLGKIYSKKIVLNDVHIISNLESETLNGVNKAILQVGDNTFNLAYSQVNQLLSGSKIEIESGGSLKSNKEYDFSIDFYDKSGNKLNTIGNTGVVNTSKIEPTVSLALLNREIDYVQIGITLSNVDDVNIDNYRYVVFNSAGQIVTSDKITSDKIKLENLDPNGIYSFEVLGDINTHDGNGVRENYSIGKIEFSTLSLSSLGYLNLYIEKGEIYTDKVVFNLNINEAKTNKVLIKLLKNITLTLYDENDDGAGQKSINLGDEEFAKLVSGEVVPIEFEYLHSNGNYSIKTSSTAQQGNEKYTNTCIINESSFETRKVEARAIIDNMLVSTSMIDFDVQIVDPDNSIISTFARVELRNDKNTLVESTKINVNDEPFRITYNNLEEFAVYTLYVFVDEYNETSSTDTYEAPKYLYEHEFRAEEGISGSIELINSKRQAVSKNIADVHSNLKWIESFNTYNLHHTVDDNDIVHIYSKTGAAAYIYDLSEYWGRMVKVSAKVRAVNPTKSGALYITNYITGTTSSSYGYKITPSTTSWTNVSYNFVIGSYNYSSANIYYSQQSTYYGKSYNDGVGFYISGGTSEKAEYEIADFQIEVYPEEEIVNSAKDVKKGIKPFEQGYYNNTGTKNNGSLSTYVRYYKEIDIDSTGYYRFDFADYKTQEFTAYFKVFDSANKAVTQYNDYRSGDNIYLKEGNKVAIYFYRARGYETPNLNTETGEVENLYLTVQKVYEAKRDGTTPGKADYPTTRTRFDYNLNTKVKVSIKVSDSVAGFTTRQYYVRAYYDDTYQDYVYNDLENISEVKDLIKEIPLAENKDYTLELGVKVGSRYYRLDSFDLSTAEEVGSITNTNEFKWIQPYGNYVVLNDIDFGTTTYYIGYDYNRINGTIDFQGYTMTIQTDVYDNMRKIYYMGKEGVIKNLVLDVHVNHTTGKNEYGFVMYNYGTTDGLYINVYDDRKEVTKDPMFTLYSYQLYKGATIKNFVINLTNDFKTYDETGLLVDYFRGEIKNGYIYGGDMVVDTELNSGDTYRKVALVAGYGYSQSLLHHVYALSNVKYNTNFSYDLGGMIEYETYGDIKDVYVIGDTNPQLNSRGPIVAYIRNAGSANNLYYMSDNYYQGTYQNRMYPVALRNPEFQKSVLGDEFNVEEMVDLGYYPHVIFSSNKMPKQPYIDLPRADDEEIDIVSWEIVEKTNNSAIVDLIINNPYGEDVVSIAIADAETEIVSQRFDSGNTFLRLNVKNPTIFKSKYVIRNLKSRFGDFTSTKTFPEGEKYLLVDFYKEINTVADWKTISKSIDENYILMNDLNFYGETGYLISRLNGKLDGNGHTLRNIEINKSYYGLFNYLYGSISNLYVEGLTKTVKGTNGYTGLVGVTYQGSSINNVHVRDVNFVMPGDVTGTIYMGGLVGYVSYGRVSYSSATNVNITTTAEVSSLYIGGLIGRMYSGSTNDSYAANVNINISNAYYANGVGGLIGVADASGDGNIENVYATGNINTNTSTVGGLVGSLYCFLDKGYSSVNIKSTLGQLGGIAGYLNSQSYISNSLFTGNISSNVSGLAMGRIAGNINATNNNYAYADTLINGSSDYVTYDEPILTLEQLKDELTYTEIIKMEDHFDYSQLIDEIQPKLFNEDLETRQKYQLDTPFYIEKFRMSLPEPIIKNADNAKIVLKVDNPEGYYITNIEIEYMDTIIDTNTFVEDHNGSYNLIVLIATPNKFFDNYLVSKVIYKETKASEEKTFDKMFMINCAFYQSIKSMNDWQTKVSKDYAENYFLETDLDFTGMSKDEINKSVAINRLEVPEGGAYHTIKGINITYTVNENYETFIKTLGSKMDHIRFEDITIKNATTTNNNYVNIIGTVYGEVTNCDFKNITIDAVKKSYVAIIGKNEGSLINNINIDTTNIRGYSFVGSLIATQNNNLNRIISNINAIDLNVYGDYRYIGGLFGYFYNTLDGGNTSPRTYTTNHIRLTSSVKDAENSKTRVYGKSSYVGGVAGIGDCEYCEVDFVNVEGDGDYTGGIAGQHQMYYMYHTKISDSVVRGINYVGGLNGYSRYLRYSYATRMHVIGKTTASKYVGGMIGVSPYSQYYNAIENSVIENNGTYTAGYMGYNNGGSAYYINVQNNVQVTGSDYSGGLVGYQYNASLGYNTVYDSIIQSRGNYAGGLVGIVKNKSVQSGTYYDNIVSNVDIKANAYAGGFWGGKENTFSSTNYSLYFDGDITVNDETKAGFAIGNGEDVEGYSGRGIGVYAGATINGKPAKEFVVEDETEPVGIAIENWNAAHEEEGDHDPIYADITKFNEGYLDSTSVPYKNYSYPLASYSDLYRFEKGKIYTFEMNFPGNTASGPIYQIYIYDMNGTYVTTAASSNAYFDTINSTTYTKSTTMRALKNGYFRIMLYNDNVVSSATITRRNTNNFGMQKNQIIEADILRNRLTWTGYPSGDTTSTQYDPITLGFHNTVFDYSPLGSDESNLEIIDLSGNGHIGQGYVSSVSSEGMTFDYVNDYIYTDGIQIGPKFTLTFTFRHTNTSTGYLMCYGTSSTNKITLYTGTYRLYIGINGSGRDTALDIPVRENATVTVTFDGKTWKTYVDGVYKTTGTYSSTIKPVASDLLYLGRTTSNANHYMGLISEAQIFNRVLSEDEIARNYDTHSITDSSDLVLHYDLTKYKHTTIGYYPIIAKANTPNNNSDEFIIKSPQLPSSYIIESLPSDGSGQVTKEKFAMDASIMDVENNELATDSIEDTYHVYASGVNTVNVEFDKITDDLYFEYNNEVIKVDKKVYTLYYDYNHNLDLSFGTAIEKIDKSYTKDELAKTLYSNNGKYYYILNGSLYENETKLLDKVVNLYNNLALTSDGKAYDIVSKNISKVDSLEGLASREVPLYETTYEDTIIKTYYNFSTIASHGDIIVRDGQYIAKDNNLYIFESNNLNNNIVFNTYNTNVYEFALGKDNSIKVYGEKLKSNEYITNEFITEIYGNIATNDPVIMIRYADGSIKVLDYESGKMLYELGNVEKPSMFKFVADVLTTTKIKNISNTSYKNTSTLIDSIAKTEDEEVINRITAPVIVDEAKQNNKPINHSTNNYVVSYDSSTNDYNIYSVEEVLNTKIPDEEVEVVTKKIEADKFVYNYYYGNKANTIIKDYRLYIYIGILALVVVNLVFVARRFINKHEKDA